jgi:hypothetical protein
MKYIFLLLIPLFAQAFDQNVELENCRKQFSDNLLLKDELIITSDKLSSLAFELNDFCQCVVQKRESEFKERDKDLFKWLFSGRDNRLEKEDLCAQEKLSKSNQLKYFYLVFGTSMKDFIYFELEDFYQKQIKAIATPESYFNKLSCLSRNILDSCLQTQSAYISYKCIKEKIDTDYIYKTESLCPEFSTHRAVISI